MNTQECNVEVAVYQQSKHGEPYCGDSYYYIELENQFVCILVDGLGSGKFAAESSQIVINTFKENINQSQHHFVKTVNKQLLCKRGVVLGILKIDLDAHVYTFSSIGNIGLITTDGSRKKKRNIPSAGYLASYHQDFKVTQENIEKDMNFIMFSDGIKDTELSKPYMLHSDVNDLVKSFTRMNSNVRDDDSTLIAMKYIRF